MTTTRRDALALLGASTLPLSPLRASADFITVLYQRDSTAAPPRTDPAVQAALLALEDELMKRRYQVLQPTAEVYRQMDQGPGVVVTFAEDAGLTLVVSAIRSLRELPGQDSGIAELRLSGRVFLGRHVLVAEETRGQMATRLEPGQREYGERRALELAARRAAADMAERTERRLRSLNRSAAEEIARLDAMAAAAAAGGGSGEQMVAQRQAPRTGLVQTASTLPEEHAAPARRRHALVVALSDYAAVRRAGLDMADLPGVASDATLVLSSLRELGYGNDQLSVLRDGQATSSALRGELKRLRGELGPEDQLLLFISGHGGDRQFSASGFGMPVLADYRENDPGLLDFWELQSLVKNLPCRVVWINDTCHSGGAAKALNSVVVGARGVAFQGKVRGPDASTVARSAAAGQDFAIITASAAHEVSWELPGSGGVFTTSLFKALRASKGQVPLGKLFADQVQREVVNSSQRICRENRQCQQQTPLFAYGGRGYSLRV